MSKNAVTSLTCRKELVVVEKSGGVVSKKAVTC